MDPKVAEILRKPFPESAIGKLPRVTCSTCSNPKEECKEHKRSKCRVCKAYISTQHTHLDYVGHAHVRERLLEADPDWTWEPLALTSSGLPAMDDGGGMWIRLTVGGKTMLGYGDAPGKRGGNAVKECIGDALRNAGQSFGIALDLWMKEPAGHAEAEVPTRQVERPQQTPVDRAVELRGQIAAIGKQRKQDVATVGALFFEWSQGMDIRSASVVVLAEFKDYLERADVP